MSRFFFAEKRHQQLGCDRHQQQAPDQAKDAVDEGGDGPEGGGLQVGRQQMRGAFGESIWAKKKSAQKVIADSRCARVSDPRAARSYCALTA